VNENSEGQADPVGRASAYRLDPRTGRIAFLNRINALGADPTHASVSRDGRYLFIANYSGASDPGGTLAVAPVLPDGRLAPVTQVKTHRASEVNRDRQMAPHVHSVVSSPDGRFVFAQDLGADRIYAYRYDPARPELPLTAVADQPFVALPPGSGPRHLVFSPSGRQAYLTLEMTGSVAVLDYAEGHLKLRQVLPLAPAGFTGAVGAAALHVSPDGRFLAVTDRGADNVLVSFAIDPADGSLRLVDRRAVEGVQPREFAFSPDGRFVLIANQGSDTIAVFRRDPQTGKVGERIQALRFSQPSALVFPAEAPAPHERGQQQQGEQQRGGETAQDHHGHRPLDLAPRLPGLDRHRQQGKGGDQGREQDRRDALARGFEQGVERPWAPFPSTS
jgi:6-phosphogluconolactonase (cycloisomerase 2 family)